MLAVVAVGMATPACGGDSEWGAFAPRGQEARELAILFWAMTGAGTAIFVLVLVLLVLAARRRGRDDTGEPEEQTSRRTNLLVIGGGVVLPVLVLVPLSIATLYVGSRVANEERPGDYRVEIIGHQFWWEVVYPDEGVVTANEIHIPAGRPVHMTLRTADVIHSVWVAQLAGKIDMIPGETTALRLQADEPGEYLGHCAEYCGLQHARMRFLVIAQTDAEFEDWISRQRRSAAAPATEAAVRGAEVFRTAGCASCHAVRGADAAGRLGPDLTHVASRRTLGAATMPNGRGQLAGWVMDPQATKPGNLMPPTPLDAQELMDLLEYLESLE